MEESNKSIFSQISVHLHFIQGLQSDITKKYLVKHVAFCRYLLLLFT